MTLVEIMMGTGLSTLVIGAVLTLVLIVGSEQRRALADATLYQKMATTQDRILGVLRSMSATESVIFGDAATGPGGGTVYRRVIFAKGPAPDYPREELTYSPAQKRLVHDPNTSVSGDETMIVDGQGEIQLTDVYFYPSLKVGSVPDASILNVWMEFDDGGSAGRRNPDGSVKHTTLVRSFSAKFRNI